MPRTAEFDRTRALEGAMKLFWARGYHATPLPQLLEAMGIARSSFYASFTDKRSVFEESLVLFAERTLQMLHSVEIEQAPETAPAAFFEQTLLRVSKKRSQHGCMMVNTILESADVDADLSQLAARQLQKIERRFETLFTHAQEQGRLSAAHSPAVLAQYVMNVNQGLRVSSRKGVSRAALLETINTSLLMAGLTTVTAGENNDCRNT
ncbi:MAG: TetR/AcrR family transcriptional regulator [Halioglobus sp.]